MCRWPLQRWKAYFPPLPPTPYKRSHIVKKFVSENSNYIHFKLAILASFVNSVRIWTPFNRGDHSCTHRVQLVTYGPAALLPSFTRVWKFLPRIPLLCSSSAGEKQLIVVVFLSSSFPLLRKSRAGEFLAGTFKRALMTVIKRQDLKWRADPAGLRFTGQAI